MAFRRFSFSFIEKRKIILQGLKSQEQQENKNINVEVSGKLIEGVSGKISAWDVCELMKVDQPLAVKVKYKQHLSQRVSSAEGEITEDSGFELFDLTRPLESDCEIELIDFSHPIGKHIFWHSSSHILGSALEKFTKGLLTNGPAISSGFFYDIDTGSLSLTPTHIEEINNLCERLISEDLKFKRYKLTKEEALGLFSYNPYKLHFIQNKVPANGFTSVYELGDFVDLCAGPHITSTALIKAFKLTNSSSSHWLGDTSKPLQRVSGVSFPSRSQLTQYLTQLAESSRRDHRKTGSHLYFWHPASAGSTFFLPDGTRLYNTLVNFLRHEYLFRGFTEVISPNLFNSTLWKQSGHYSKYKADMFLLNSEEEELGLKPMNCPGHCLIFDHTQRSYKELPLRLAEFGVLHRNEVSGSLSGLTRVRRFVQDDSHIFCRASQIKDEVKGCLDFIEYIYGVFGFEYELELSTRPKNALGSEAIWESAERQLKEALDENGKSFGICKGEGAFYGPKIDVKVKDALGRSHQCGTVQLDFNLPRRFDLQFRAESEAGDMEEVVKYEDFEEKRVKQGFERPVIIHRAVLGSIERFIAVLTEHYAGKWPFWISPRQMMLATISEKFEGYAEAIAKRLQIEGYHVDIDRTSSSLNKKIRNAQQMQYNYIGVIGEIEADQKRVDLRDRDTNKSIGKLSISEIISQFESLKPKSSAAKDRALQSAWSDTVNIQETVSLTDLENKLNLNPYLKGSEFSDFDLKVFKSIKYPPCETRFPKTFNWFQTLKNTKNNKSI